MSITDRKMLEMAAKVAGYKVSQHHQSARDAAIDPATASLWIDGVSTGWNPLKDDGDALRLANKLWLEVRHVHGKAHAGMQDKFWCTENWFPDGDQDAATRRAIVRAAAAIGATHG